MTYLNYDDKYNRISNIILPGDFSKQQSHEEIYVNRTLVEGTVTVPSIGWGCLDYSLGTPYLRYGTHEDQNQNQYFLANHFLMAEDNNEPQKLEPFFRFDYYNLDAFR